MGFNLNNHLQLQVVLFLVIYNLNVFAATNVTIDDQNSSITYSPPGAWTQSTPNTLDFGGTHMLTQNPNATASFNFTGIAIYFMSPLWPYTVNTAVSLDSGPTTLVDLVDHSRPNTGQGPETVQSQVVWNATGLANIQHNLRIFVGAGQPYAVVDGLIYTVMTNVSSSSSPSSLSPTTTLVQGPVIASSTANATLASSLKSKSHSVVAIALGSLFGILGLLVILCGVWYFIRRRKRPISEAWTEGISYTQSVSRNPSMSAVTDKNGNWTADQLYNNGYTLNPSNDGKSWHNPHYENVGMPAPPIPSQPYYHGGYQNGIGSRTAQMSGRISDRYEPGYALSTITERSTPQMGEGRTPLTNSPAEYQSDLEYHTAQGSEASYNVSRQQLPSSLGGIQRAPSPITQGYPSPRRKPVDRQSKPAGNWI